VGRLPTPSKGKTHRPEGNFRAVLTYREELACRKKAGLYQQQKQEYLFSATDRLSYSALKKHKQLPGKSDGSRHVLSFTTP